jgi:hypothetical protein
MTTTDSVWWIRYMARLLPEDKGQRAKEGQHAQFEDGLNGGQFDHGLRISFVFSKVGEGVTDILNTVGIVCAILGKARADS